MDSTRFGDDVVELSVEEAVAKLQGLEFDPQAETGLARNDLKPETSRVSSRVLILLHDNDELQKTRPDIQTYDSWDAATLNTSLQSGVSAFAILTQARAYPPHEAQVLIHAICRTLRCTAAQLEIDIEITVVTDGVKDVGSDLGPQRDGGHDGSTTKRNGFPQMEYKRLGNSGLRVSKLILGCMTFGNPQWEGSPWILPEDEALPLLKRAFDLGINTWETANSYSNGQSELTIGKAMSTYGIPRSKVVLTTKVYYPVLEHDPNARPQPALNDGELVNQMGLGRKHVFEAVEGSLRRLNTSYIDVLQLHRLDRDTDPEEIMCALNDLVRMGKVHYLGASSMYCWEFARLQYIAKKNKWTRFTSMSGLYNLLYREEEREMIPFCNAEGVGLIPWSPIARGLLTRPWSEQTDRSKQDLKSKKWFQGNQNEQIVARVEEIAKQKECTMSSVALAWLLRKGACPIVGLNSMERIETAAEALTVKLTDQEVERLESSYMPLAVQAM